MDMSVLHQMKMF